MAAAILLRTGLLVLLMAAPQVGVFAEGSDASSDLSHSRRGSSDETGEKGPVVHVGAGTTSASTTGYSGKAGKKPASLGGELEVPPTPSSSVCDDYKGTASHPGCLQVVLPGKGKGL